MKNILKAILGLMGISWLLRNRAKNDVLNNKSLQQSLEEYADAHKKAYKSITEAERNYEKRHPGKKLFSDETIKIFKDPPTLDL